MNDEINKNQKLETEIKKLKEIVDKYKLENEKLKADLSKANKIILDLQNNQINSNELKSLRDENNKLKYELSVKENEIKDLKNKIQNNHYGIKCLPTDIFAEVEEKLYQKYDNLRNTNNMFNANDKLVLRFKTICENNIKDGDILQLFKLE